MKVEKYEDIHNCVNRYGYVCISHVWGDQKKYKPEELGIKSGVNWEVPLSDPDKISRIRKAMIKYRKKYCWFDVLCMPQDNQEEINLEVPLMGDYYSGARITFVLSAVSCTVSENFAKWSDIMSDIIQDLRGFTEEEHGWMCCLSHEYNLSDLYKDEWFKRVWTLQEAVLSKKLILIDVNRLYVDLSDVARKVSYTAGIYELYAWRMFGKSTHYLLELGLSIIQHEMGVRPLTHVMSRIMEKNCYKIHDRFYGALGILGYKDFLVNYNIDIKELNEKIIRHAYSKGDISWLSVGGNVGSGFIQPIYQNFTSVGDVWNKEALYIRDTILGTALWINVVPFATVIRCERFDISGDPIADLKRFLKWVYDTFRSWGSRDADMVKAMAGYCYMPNIAIKIIGAYLCAVFGGIDSDTAIRQLETMFNMDPRIHIRNFLSDMKNVCTIYKDASIAMGALDGIDNKIILIICGNVDVGDKILLTNTHDDMDRTLGIVVSGSTRKGVYIYKRIEIPSYLYTLYELTL